MAYGMRIYDTDGSTIYYDSTSEGGIFVEFATLFTWTPSTPSEVRTITYDGSNGRRNLQGMRLKVMNIFSGDVAYNIIDPVNSTSYPQITYKQPSSSLSLPLYERKNTTLMVLAL